MFDLLDEVPQQHGAYPFVTSREQLVPVVEDHLEQGRERRFEVGDVGQVELDILTFEQLVVGGVRGGVGLAEAGVLGDHRLGVRTVGPGVLGFLADERVRFFGDDGVGNAGQGLPGGRDDVPLEGDGQECERISEQPEGRIRRLPLERDRLVDPELWASDGQIRHIPRGLHIYAKVYRS